MMIIDAHTHALHGPSLDKIMKAGGDAAKKLIETEVAWTKKNEIVMYLDPKRRVEALNKYGIDYQVCTPGGHRTDVNIFPGGAKRRLNMAQALNDNMAGLMEDSKGKLLGVGNVPLKGFNDECAGEMERAIGLGLKGMNVPSHIDGKPLDAPEFYGFWEKAMAMDIPVWVHPRDPARTKDRVYEAEFDLIHNFGWPFETVLALARMVFSGFMDRFPKLKIVSHHLGGGMIPFFFGRTMETYMPEKQPRLIGKTLPRSLYDYFSSFYLDTAVGGSVEAIRCCYDVFGKADRMIFATDAPYGPKHGEGRLETYPKVIRSLGLSESEAEKILSGNARKLLKMD
jgi:predicted TIM-barrel fold metal-dependent hydrolase